MPQVAFDIKNTKIYKDRKHSSYDSDAVVYNQNNNHSNPASLKNPQAGSSRKISYLDPEEAYNTGLCTLFQATSDKVDRDGYITTEQITPDDMSFARLRTRSIKSAETKVPTSVTLLDIMKYLPTLLTTSTGALLQMMDLPNFSKKIILEDGLGFVESSMGRFKLRTRGDTAEIYLPDFKSSLRIKLRKNYEHWDSILYARSEQSVYDALVSVMDPNNQLTRSKKNFMRDASQVLYDLFSRRDESKFELEKKHSRTVSSTDESNPLLKVKTKVIVSFSTSPTGDRVLNITCSSFRVTSSNDTGVLIANHHIDVPIKRFEPLLANHLMPPKSAIQESVFDMRKLLSSDEAAMRLNDLESVKEIFHNKENLLSFFNDVAGHAFYVTPIHISEKRSVLCFENKQSGLAFFVKLFTIEKTSSHSLNQDDRADLLSNMYLSCVLNNLRKTGSHDVIPLSKYVLASIKVNAYSSLLQKQNRALVDGAYKGVKKSNIRPSCGLARDAFRSSHGPNKLFETAGQDVPKNGGIAVPQTRWAPNALERVDHDNIFRWQILASIFGIDDIRSPNCLFASSLGKSKLKMFVFDSSSVLHDTLLTKGTLDYLRDSTRYNDLFKLKSMLFLTTPFSYDNSFKESGKLAKEIMAESNIPAKLSECSRMMKSHLLLSFLTQLSNKKGEGFVLREICSAFQKISLSLGTPAEFNSTFANLLTTFKARVRELSYNGERFVSDKMLDEFVRSVSIGGLREDYYTEMFNLFAHIKSELNRKAKFDRNPDEKRVKDYKEQISDKVDSNDFAQMGSSANLEDDAYEYGMPRAKKRKLDQNADNERDPRAGKQVLDGSLIQVLKARNLIDQAGKRQAQRAEEFKARDQKIREQRAAKRRERGKADREQRENERKERDRRVLLLRSREKKANSDPAKGIPKAPARKRAAPDLDEYEGGNNRKKMRLTKNTNLDQKAKRQAYNADLIKQVQRLDDRRYELPRVSALKPESSRTLSPNYWRSDSHDEKEVKLEKGKLHAKKRKENCQSADTSTISMFNLSA